MTRGQQFPLQLVHLMVSWAETCSVAISVNLHRSASDTVQHGFCSVILSHIWSDYSRGFGLEIGFMDHFNTRLVTTLNYSVIANLDNSQITTALSIPLPACCVFTNLSLVTASNSGVCSASALKFSVNGGSQLSLFFTVSRTELTWLPQLSSLAREGNTVHSRMLTVSAGTFLPSRSLAATVCY
jgi:hypothetical protein